MNLKAFARRIALSAALLVIPATAQAQESEGGWIVSVGPGIALEPKFPGAKDAGIGLWPLINGRRIGAERRFETPDDSFGPSLIGSRRFRFGPSLEVEGGRDEEDAIDGIGDVGTTIEAGAFLEAFLSDNFRFRADVRKGFGGHKGLIADLGADVIAGDPDQGAAHFSIGPRIRIANNRYVGAFYGINPEQSDATGLPEYDADGGLHSAGALAFAAYKVAPRVELQGYARYDRLLGDAKNSPLVMSSVGSRNQYEVGIGLTYDFVIR